jgi:uncharacterized protein YjbI with pentapeptide repeats
MFRLRRVQFDARRFRGYRPVLTELGFARRWIVHAVTRPFVIGWRVLSQNTFIALFIAAFILVALALIALAPSEMFEARFWLSSPEDVRTLVLLFASLGGAAIATIGLWLSNKRADAALQQSFTTQENHYTDLLVRAGEQLSHDSTLVRMVGIHSLDRVARHSEQDRRAVATILAEFLQQSLAKVDGEGVTEIRKRVSGEKQSTRGDVEAAAEALSRTMEYLKRDKNFTIRLRSVVLPNQGVLGDCRGWEFENCVFLDTDLDGARFEGCMLSGTKISGCSFNIATFDECTLEDVQFSSCRFPTASFDGAYWTSGRYNRLYFGKSYFKRTAFFSPVFTECDFHHADFRGAKFLGTRFVRCDFSGAYLDECVVRDREETFSECGYLRSNPPFVSKEIDLTDTRFFVAHDNPQGIIKTH